MTLNLQEVARAIGADSHLPPLEITGWSVDTRTQNPGDVYFALRGPNHDGHDFLAAAAEKGASAVVVESSGIRPSPVQVGQALSPANPPGGSELRSDWQAEACPTELLVPSRRPQSCCHDTEQISWGNSSRLPRAIAGSTLPVLDEYGLRETAPARPTLAPHIRFLFIDSRFCSTLLSDPASRRRLCVSLTLHLHQVG